LVTHRAGWLSKDGRPALSLGPEREMVTEWLDKLVCGLETLARVPEEFEDDTEEDVI
jgi:hypothetical protein